MCETKQEKPFKNRVIALFASLLMLCTFLGEFDSFAKEISAKAEEIQNTEEEAQEVEYIELPQEVPESKYEEDIILNEEVLELEDIETLLVPTTSIEPIPEKEMKVLAQKQMLLAQDSNTSSVTFGSDEYYKSLAETELFNFTAAYDYSKIVQGEKDTATFIYADDDFAFNYNIYFSSHKELPTGCVEIVVPAELFEFREDNEQGNTTSADHKKIPTPYYDGEFQKNEDGIYQIPANIPETDDSFYYFSRYNVEKQREEYVFVNYKPIQEGNNVRLGVVYNTFKLFDIPDGTKWEIDPEITVIYAYDRQAQFEKTINSQTDTYTFDVYNGSDGKTYYCIQENATAATGETVFRYYEKNSDGNLNLTASYTQVGTTFYEGVSETGDAIANMENFFTIDTVPLSETTVNQHLTEDKALTGIVDNQVTLGNVRKTALDLQKSYGNNLYTSDQVKEVLGYDISSEYYGENYILTGWAVQVINSNCTQPWKLYFDEDTGDGGKVVGVSLLNYNNKIKCQEVSGVTLEENQFDTNSGKTAGDFNSNINDVWLVADGNHSGRPYYRLGDITEGDNFTLSYYVVVAYDTRNAEIEKYTETDNTTTPPKNVTYYRYKNKEGEDANFKNTVTAYMVPEDSGNPDQIVDGENIVDKVKTDSDSAITPYKEYVFEYKGADGDAISKKAESDYRGWLSAYDLGNDPLSFTFTVNSEANHYKYTHDENNKYEYNAGKYVKVITADDVIIAEPYGRTIDHKDITGDPYQLTSADYYYSNAEFTVNEYDIDKANDKEIKPASPKLDDTGVEEGWYVYYRKNESDSDWTAYNPDEGNDKPELTLQEYIGGKSTFKIDFSDIKPYQVKIEHKTTNARSTVSMKLTMNIKKNSPCFNKTNGYLRTNLKADEETITSSSDAKVDWFRINIKNFCGMRTIDNTGNNCISSVYNDTDYNNSVYKKIGSFKYANRKPYVVSVDSNGTKNWTYTSSDEGTTPVKRAGTIYADAFLQGSETDQLTIIDNVRRAGYSVYVGELEKHAGAEKYAVASSSGANKRVNITYTLSGFEGYYVESQLYDTMVSQFTIPPSREVVYFYDLLPPDVEYDASVMPTVGKLGIPQVYKGDVEGFVGEWENNVSVEVETIPRWENTGRTMVIFKLKLNDEEGKYDSDTKMWFIGCGVRFNAYVSWTDYAAASAEDNRVAYVVSETNSDGNAYSSDLLGKKDTEIYPDNGSLIPSGYDVFKNKSEFDEDENAIEYNRVYAKAGDLGVQPTNSQTSITKTVRADSNTTGAFTAQTGVMVGENYTYRISVDFSGKEQKGMVIYDKLESVDTYNGWQGSLNADINTSSLANYFKALDPTFDTSRIQVYYTKSSNPIEPWKDSTIANKFEHGTPLLDTSFTADSTEWTSTRPTEFEENERITAFFVYVNGADKKLPDTITTSIDVHMTAPPSKKDSLYAVNEASYLIYENSVKTEGKSVKTYVTLGERMKLVIQKSPGISIPDDLKDEEFIFTITAMVINGIKTETNGTTTPILKPIKFANVNYKIYEKVKSGTKIAQNVYWADGATSYQDGKFYIDSNEVNNATLNNAQITKNDVYWVQGAEFKDGYFWLPIDENIPHATDVNGQLSLKFNQRAEFTYIPSTDYTNNYVIESTSAELGKYELDAYYITEEEKPYWHTEKTITTETNKSVIENGKDVSYKQATADFVNDYRPVIYLSKTLEGIAEDYAEQGTSQDFTFNIRIKDASGYLTKEKLNDTNKLLNKLFVKKDSDTTLTDFQAQDLTDGVLYCYDTDNWTIINTPLSPNDDGIFNVTLKAGEKIGIPIYITGGMLDFNGKAKYTFEVTEQNTMYSDGATIYNPTSNWYILNPVTGNSFTSGSDTDLNADYTNTYRYKNILLTKTVTHCDDTALLEDTAFRFKISRASGEDTTLNSNITWELLKMNTNGDFESFSPNIGGTIGADGEFIVPKCGVSGRYIKIKNIELNYKYTIQEITDIPEDNASIDGYTYNASTGRITKDSASYILGTKADYSATKGTSAQTISPKTDIADFNIENDYNKRSLTVSKTVAAASYNANDQYTIQVRRADGEKFSCNWSIKNLQGSEIANQGSPNANTLVTFNQGSAGAYYCEFKLKADESITFKYVGNVGERFIIQETAGTTETIKRLSDETETITLSDVNETSVLNGDDSYIVIKKQYTGADNPTMRAAVLNYDINLKLSLKDTEGNILTIPETVTISDYVSIKDSTTPITSLDNISMKGTNTLIVNFAGLCGALGRTKENTGYTVEETLPQNSKSYTATDGTFYYIQPEQNGVFSAESGDTHQLIVKNHISEFSSVIYKRIANKTDKTKPTGDLVLNITDMSGNPVSGIQYLTASENSISLNPETTDKDGTVKVQATSDGWKQSDGREVYYVKIYFDADVKINATSGYSISENRKATSEKWGVPVGYEIYNASEYVNSTTIEGNNQWIEDADTFVNTTDKKQIKVSKSVEKMKSGDEYTEFTYTVAEYFTSGRYSVVPDVKYTRYTPAYQMDSDGNVVYVDGIPQFKLKDGEIDYKTKEDKTDEKGQFTLMNGEYVILEVPEYSSWRILEDNSGEYRLKTGTDGLLTADALSATDDGNKYNIKEVPNGFTLRTSKDIPEGMKEGAPVVLINGARRNTAYADYAMFAIYSSDVGDNYYNKSNGVNFYNTSQYIICKNSSNPELSSITEIGTSVSDGVIGGIVWSQTGGEQGQLKQDANHKIKVPELVYCKHSDGIIYSHKVVGIGEYAYYSRNVNDIQEVDLSEAKYLTDIGWGAFHSVALSSIDWYPSNTTYGVKTIWNLAFSDTSVNMNLVNPLENIYASAFQSYKGGAGNRNAGDTALILPSTLKRLETTTNSTNYLSSNLKTLRIGSEANIADMTTSFTKISNTVAEYTLRTSNLYFSPHTIIVGKNAKGIEIENMEVDGSRGTTIVLPSGNVTLDNGCINKNDTKLLVLQTENLSDLTFAGNAKAGNSYAIFPNITSMTDTEKNTIKAGLNYSDTSRIILGDSNGHISCEELGTVLNNIQNLNRMDEDVLDFINPTRVAVMPKWTYDADTKNFSYNGDASYMKLMVFPFDRTHAQYSAYYTFNLGDTFNLDPNSYVVFPNLTEEQVTADSLAATPKQAWANVIARLKAIFGDNYSTHVIWGKVTEAQLTAIKTYVGTDNLEADVENMIYTPPITPGRPPYQIPPTITTTDLYLDPKHENE